MTETPTCSPFRTWWLAARPKTLSAAIVPVLIGAALAYRTNPLDVPILLFILASTICIQIGTNLANDYSDFKSGADSGNRLGPMRVTQAGLLAPESVRRGAILFFVTAVIFGLPLIYRGGWPILAIGLVGILCGWAYTGGPYPLGYNGLGELFVLAFFGLAAVAGTHYLLAGFWSVDSLVLGLCPGMLASALLAANNVRDLETDRATGKRTLPVRFGRAFGQAEYLTLIALPYLVPLWLLLRDSSAFVLLPWLSLPLAIRPARLMMTRSDGPSLIQALEDTSKLSLVFGILLTLGIVL